MAEYQIEFLIETPIAFLMKRNFSFVYVFLALRKHISVLDGLFEDGWNLNWTSMFWSCILHWIAKASLICSL